MLITSHNGIIIFPTVHVRGLTRGYNSFSRLDICEMIGSDFKVKSLETSIQHFMDPCFPYIKKKKNMN